MTTLAQLERLREAHAAANSTSMTVGEGEQPMEILRSTADDEAFKQMELKKKARLLQVSTEDSEVKAYLRQLNEPICLFGEDGADRRLRLQLILVVSGAPCQRPPIGQTGVVDKEERDDTIVWYHEGPPSLVEARRFITEYSLVRAKRRLERARDYYTDYPAPLRKAKLQEYHKNLRVSYMSATPLFNPLHCLIAEQPLIPNLSYIFTSSKQTSLLCSQVGDVRPLSMCRFSPDGSQLATSSWSGLVKLWSVPDCEPLATLRGHSAPVYGLAWHPRAGLDQEEQIALASCAQDGSVKLWSLGSEEPLADIEGHSPHRVTRLAFHPSGRMLATTCFDHSWRLWDLSVCEEVLHQEGHSKPVYDAVFHPDGSLVLTTSMDSYARVWDLRTGRCVMFLDGHLEELLGADIADNGFHAATASVDATVRIWDLRQQQAIYVLPAHQSVVSSVRFENRKSHYLLTSSYDKTAKIWGHPVWAPIKTLEGHNSKVSYADSSPDSKYCVTCSHDLTFKLWSRDE